MTRLWTEGFELATVASLTYGGGNASIFNLAGRGGYGAYVVRADSNAVKAYQTIPASAEIYGRMAFQTELFSSGVTIVTWQKGTTVLGWLKLNTSGLIEIYCTGLVATGTKVLAINSWYLIEWRVKIGDSPDGQIQVRVDGYDEVSYLNNDTKPGADTTIDRILISYITTAGGYCKSDDWGVNDINGAADNSWVGDGHIIALLPNASGDLTQWTPNTGADWAAVDDRPNNGDTDYVKSPTTGQQSCFNLAAAGLIGVTIQRVFTQFVSRKTNTSDAIKVRSLIKSGGVVYRDAAAQDQFTYYAGFTSDTPYTNDPATAIAWTVAGLDALQAGVEVD